MLVRALRTGDSAINVPAYNGALFSASSLPGAALLETASISNDTFGRALAALGRDEETGLGVDYSSLEIGHLGHLYEGLLSLHVAVADTDLALYPTGEKKSLRYEPRRSPRTSKFLPAGFSGKPIPGAAKREGFTTRPNCSWSTWSGAPSCRPWRGI